MPIKAETVKVELKERAYTITIAQGEESGWITPLSPFVRGKSVAVITEKTVAALYREAFHQTLLKCRAEKVFWIVVEPGESSKSLKVLEQAYDLLLSNYFGRDGVICAFGGGVIGDLAGFVAASIHRGVSVLQVPTTLLSMVDSSIGGKTGINHSQGKNLIGAFHQPLAVACNIDVLATLPEREKSCGFAEVIKYGAISSSGLFERLEGSRSCLLTEDNRELLDIVADSARIKSKVVAQDERESGLRMVLNFGHTLGHAIEAAQGYGKWSHGEAIAVGMVMAAQFGVSRGLTDKLVVERLKGVCGQFHLPIEIDKDMKKRLIEAIGHDKKVRGSDIKFIFVPRIGEALVQRVALDVLADWLTSA